MHGGDRRAGRHGVEGLVEPAVEVLAHERRDAVLLGRARRQRPGDGSPPTTAPADEHARRHELGAALRSASATTAPPRRAGTSGAP